MLIFSDRLVKTQFESDIMTKELLNQCFLHVEWFDENHFTNALIPTYGIYKIVTKELLTLALHSFLAFYSKRFVKSVIYHTYTPQTQTHTQSLYPYLYLSLTHTHTHTHSWIEMAHQSAYFGSLITCTSSLPLQTWVQECEVAVQNKLQVLLGLYHQNSVLCTFQHSELSYAVHCSHW